MKRILFEFIALVALFFTTYFLFSRFEWVSIFKIERITKSTEEKLGDVFWEFLSKTENEIHSKSIKGKLDTLVNKICTSNSIDKSSIKLHVLRKSDINAFALPNNHLVVFSGLIENCENEEELCGVLGHEIAHMQKNHVMKKLVKEVGLGMIITMSSGKGNPEIAKEIAKLLSSSAYDRNLEREADMTSVEYLLKAKIDPEPFANFLYRLGDENKNIPNQVYWISTHPDSKERAENIIATLKGKLNLNESILTDEEWANFKRKFKELN